ncbi:MAG: hypothetical protein ACOCRK_02955 [bacterium]
MSVWRDDITISCRKQDIINYFKSLLSINIKETDIVNITDRVRTQYKFSNIDTRNDYEVWLIKGDYDLDFQGLCIKYPDMINHIILFDKFCGIEELTLYHEFIHLRQVYVHPNDINTNIKIRRELEAYLKTLFYAFKKFHISYIKYAYKGLSDYITTI